MFFILENVLSKTDLDKAQKLIANAKFIDGAATARTLSKDTKSNLEMEVGETYSQLAALLDQAIDANVQIACRIFPRYRVNPIINRYDEQMYYREHIDSPIQGARTQFGRSPGRFGQSFIRTDYSMTLFLTPPEAYDGGELELSLEDRPRLVKLSAGSAVCYQTGIPHSVRMITRGSRICAIYWFQSLIKDVTLRRTLWDLYSLRRKLEVSGSKELAAEAESVRLNFLRYLADV
jgi:PKHD-type hydroxylase